MLYWNQKDQIAICDMSTDHIKNCLEYLKLTSVSLSDTDVRKYIRAFELELAARNSRRYGEDSEVKRLERENRELREAWKVKAKWAAAEYHKLYVAYDDLYNKSFPWKI